MTHAIPLQSARDGFDVSVWRSKRPLFEPQLRHDHDSYDSDGQSPRPNEALSELTHSRTASEPLRSSAKRAIDIVCAAGALLVFSPLFAAVALAIKITSPGPIFFKQHRYGHRSRPFVIYKFRTMYTHLSDAGGTEQTRAHDPRVTPIGRFLRRTSLDELPQLINVARGDMSLVGPRPHVPGMQAASTLYETLVPYYFQRHAIRPGITGLAQVSGCRGSTAEAAAAISRVDYDLEYIERWTLLLDVLIILRTVKNEFLSGEAY